MDHHTLLNENTRNTNDYGSYCIELSNPNECTEEYPILNSETYLPQTTVVTTDDYFLFELNFDKKSYTISAKDKGSIPFLITIPKEYNQLPVTAIKKEGFSCCTNLSIVLFEEKSNLKIIGSFAFLGCTKMESIELPGSIKSIHANAFRSCSLLQQVYLHSKFPPRLGCMAFYNTSVYLKIYVPFESIAYYKNFIGWSKYNADIHPLPSLIPSNLGYFTFTKNSDETGYTLIAKDRTIIPLFLVIPSYYNRMPVKEIGDTAFLYSLIKEVVIPDSIESIGIRAISHDNTRMNPDFQRSNSILEKVFISSKSKLKYIGDAAFSGNNKLTKFYIPPEVTFIGSGAFLACDFSYIHIPKKVQTIGRSPFWQNTHLQYISVDKENPNYKDIDGVLFNKDVTLLIEYPLGCDRYRYSVPATVQTFHASLWGCQNLRVLTFQSLQPPIMTGYQFDVALKAFKVYVPAESYELYKTATGFEHYKNLLYPDNIIKDGFAIQGNLLIQYVENDSEITLPEEITEIQNYALASCARLNIINVLESNATFKSVDGVLFNSDLTELICYPAGKTSAQYEIPCTVKTIGCAAFLGCCSLNCINTHALLETISEDAFYRCRNLMEVVNLDAKDQIKTIKKEAFFQCDSLTEVNLTALKTMAINAFFLCYNLEKITLGEDITYLGWSSFGHIFYEIKLDMLTIYAKNPPALYLPRYSKFPTIIKVPPDSLDSYKNAEIWRDVSDRIYPLTQTIMK